MTLSVKEFHGAWMSAEADVEQLRADLLATRRALKMAQAAALVNLAGFLSAVDDDGDERTRKVRLLMHWARKLEREDLPVPEPETGERR
jgi:hypothetical protein